LPFATLLALKIITTLLPLTMRHFDATLWHFCHLRHFRH
jgi:hypothetical protein